jgi:hypothetical protein
MLQDLAALTPPAIVCAAVLIGAWAIVRHELAPKRKERADARVAADEERAVDREHGRSLYPDISDLSRPDGWLCAAFARRMSSPVIIRFRPWERIAVMTTYAWAIC